MKKKAPYRNAIRSRELLQEAFLQLLSTKDIGKIKTQEVIELANLSKGTFYAHYTNLFDLWQDVENNYLARLFRVFEEHPPVGIFEDFFPLFECGLTEMAKSLTVYRLLFRTSCGESFLNRLRGTFLEYMMATVTQTGDLQDLTIAQAYFTFVAGGAIALIQSWLESDAPPAPQMVAKFLSECALNGAGSLEKQKFSFYAVP